MTLDLIGGGWYQFAGKIRVWLGTIANSEVEVNEGKRDQLIGRITQHCGVSLEDAESIASVLTTNPPNQNHNDLL
jgi:uncharacterized protein YjbJ (UPF0337 family)